MEVIGGYLWSRKDPRREPDTVGATVVVRESATSVFEMYITSQEAIPADSRRGTLQKNDAWPRGWLWIRGPR